MFIARSQVREGQEFEAVFCSLSPPGALAPTVALERLTRYSYVKALAFWVDVTAQGKIVSKLFQRSDLLMSDITSGVEDSVAAIAKLKEAPGSFMKGLAKDFDAAHETLYGRELSGMEEGKEAY